MGPMREFLKLIPKSLLYSIQLEVSEVQQFLFKFSLFLLLSQNSNGLYLLFIYCFFIDFYFRCNYIREQWDIIFVYAYKLHAAKHLSSAKVQKNLWFMIYLYFKGDVRNLEFILPITYKFYKHFCKVKNLQMAKCPGL